MDTIKLNSVAQWTAEKEHSTNKTTFYDKWLALEDTQSKNKTFWFVTSMIVQGIFFLPVPAFLIFYFNAPTMILAITMVLFFSNIIAGMGGLGIRVLMSLFVLSALTHLVMLLIFAL